jgi:NADH-quinone oxidoreductase subunit D
MSSREIRNYTLNFGPQHPAAHGVLRLVLEMDGEVVQRADPHIGLLHRGTEKLAESKPYNQSIGYMDRLDYVSMMCNEHAYVRAIEGLIGVEVPERAQYIRTMFDEITRILNHLMWIGSNGLDLGAMAVFLYAFREREELMDCYEAVSGAPHARHVLPPGRRVPRPARADAQVQGVALAQGRRPDAQQRMARGSMLDFLEPSQRLPAQVDEYETLLTDNRIWKQRTVGIGVVPPEMALAWGMTGPMLRGSASPGTCARNSPTRPTTRWTSTCRWACRATATTATWCAWKKCASPIASSSSAWNGCGAITGRVMTQNFKVSPRRVWIMKDDMEALIHHFKLFTEGYSVPAARYIRRSKRQGRVRRLSDFRRRQ